MRAALLLALVFAVSAAGRELQQAAASSPAALLHPASTAASTQSATAAANTGAVALQPQATQRRTLEEVNANAPTYTDPSSQVSIRPVASSQVVGQDTVTATNPALAGKPQVAAAKPKSQHIGVVNPQDVAVSADPLTSGVGVSGTYISFQTGARVATPLFGTGFNFCIGTPPAACLYIQLGCRLPQKLLYLRRHASLTSILADT